MTRIIAAWCMLLLAALPGCKNPETVRDTLLVLQQGKARGHITMTTDARVSVSQAIHFGIGPEHSSISFDGDVDFGDSVRHEVDFGNHPHTAGDPIPLTTDPDLTAPNADDE